MWKNKKGKVIPQFSKHPIDSSRGIVTSYYSRICCGCQKKIEAGEIHWKYIISTGEKRKCMSCRQKALDNI